MFGARVSNRLHTVAGKEKVWTVPLLSVVPVATVELQNLDFEFVSPTRAVAVLRYQASGISKDEVALSVNLFVPTRQAQGPTAATVRLLLVPDGPGPRFEIDNRYLFSKHLTIIGSTMGTSVDYETVMGLVFAGRLRPVIDTVYPLRDAVTALARLRDGDVMGKLVLRIPHEKDESG